jgi:DNA-binding FadR family transcriptional regulator
VTRDQHSAGQEHRELLDACKTKNRELAAAALWKHIANAGQYATDVLQGCRQSHGAGDQN